jgi:hypothetical protein
MLQGAPSILVGARIPVVTSGGFVECKTVHAPEDNRLLARPYSGADVGFKETCSLNAAAAASQVGRSDATH